MNDAELFAVLDATVDAVRTALGTVADRTGLGDRPGQYALDLVTDAAAVAVLVDAGLGVLSEESGRHHPDRGSWVVIDPVDGSTNASHGIPWYCTSLAVVDEDGLRAALVVNLVSGARYSATRGGGAFKDGEPIKVTSTTELSDALLILNGHVDRHLGWRQFRVLGAAALDLCLVAEGVVDGYHDAVDVNLGPWDYLGGALIVTEAGGVISDAWDRPLLVDDITARRSPRAAATRELHDAIRAADPRDPAGAQ
ncbi:MAG TPA: inositol monophosphatase [Microthrixaceae bacterium]|nr:inositol monophosphatase [Microthrixaceae bacterium]